MDQEENPHNSQVLHYLQYLHIREWIGWDKIKDPIESFSVREKCNITDLEYNEKNLCVFHLDW